MKLMENRGVEIIVYGAEELCPSCLHSPSSKETFDWLNAAISRKYPEQPFEITYVDINNPPSRIVAMSFCEPRS